MEEKFGATVERINIPVKRGDWLVFHVVNNRLRWGGVRYFALAGCVAPNEFGFVSNLDDGNWSATDAPHEIDAFIGLKTHLQHRAAQPVTDPWSDGTPLMRQYAGEAWNGAPVWGGNGRSTWVKVQVE